LQKKTQAYFAGNCLARFRFLLNACSINWIELSIYCPYVFRLPSSFYPQDNNLNLLKPQGGLTGWGEPKPSEDHPVGGQIRDWGLPTTTLVTSAIQIICFTAFDLKFFAEKNKSSPAGNYPCRRGLGFLLNACSINRVID